MPFGSPLMQYTYQYCLCLSLLVLHSLMFYERVSVPCIRLISWTSPDPRAQASVRDRLSHWCRHMVCSSCGTRGGNFWNILEPARSVLEGFLGAVFDACSSSLVSHSQRTFVLIVDILLWCL